MELEGIHHLTAVSAQIRENHHFYTQKLGMRLVKRSVNQDDVSAYHLFYADALGSPGTDLTFFDWPVPRERRGTRSIVRTHLRVAGLDALTGGRSTCASWASPPARSPSATAGCRWISRIPRGSASRWWMTAAWARRTRGIAALSRPPHQVRGLGPIVLSVPNLKPTDTILQQALNMRPVREYPHPDNPQHTVHVYEMGAGGAAAELHVAVQPGLPPARAGRGRRPPRGLPHARRRLRCLGRAPEHAGHPEQRQGRSLLVPQPLLPRAERRSCSRSPRMGRALGWMRTWRRWARRWCWRRSSSRAAAIVANLKPID